MGDEEDVFRRAMQGVRRQQVKKRVAAARPGVSVSVREAVAAVTSPTHHASPHKAGSWVLRADGVASERLRRLAAGRPPVEVELDLHGMTRDEALAALEGLLARSMAGGVRVLSVVHGRGLHSKDGRPVLKSAVYDWLRSGPFAGYVLAVVPKPGSGGGSCLILLRRQR